MDAGTNERQTREAVKVLWWALCLLALVVSAFLGFQGKGDYTVVVSGPSAEPTAQRGAIACPPRTLPDEGACVPVPRPKESPDSVPRIPTRPEAFESYELPAAGEVLLGSFSDVEGDGEAPFAGPAWIIAAEAASEVISLALGGRAPVLHALEGDWILLSAIPDSASDPGPRLLAALGPIEVAPGLAIGAPARPGTVLGHARRFGLGFAVKELRPNETLGAGFASFDDSRSVSVDPRNVLTERAAPGASR
jgi:hypothetical protein